MLESLNAFKFLIVGLNLFILYKFLKRILFKPVTKFMEDRTNSIKDSIANAEKAKIEAAELKSKYEEQLLTAKVEADRILKDARSRASKEYDSVLITAKQDADGVLARAREEIERERLQMIKEIKNQVAGLALAAASKVIEVNMDTENNRVIVNKFIEDENAA